MTRLGRPLLDGPWRGNVRAASLVNVPLLQGEQAVGGVLSCRNGDRVLLTAQTDARQNGPWIISTGAWRRPADFSDAANALGARFYVEEGPQAGSDWHCTTPAPITVGLTALTIQPIAWPIAEVATLLRAFRVQAGQIGPVMNLPDFHGRIVGIDGGGQAVPITPNLLPNAINAINILDSTVSGRALLTALSATAQRTLLDVPSNAQMTTADSGVASTAAAATAAVDARASRRLNLAETSTPASSVQTGTWAFYETGALFPGIYPWQDASNVAVPITETFIRETVSFQANLGIRTLVLITGVEKFGWALYPFSFAAWNDEQAGRTLQNWQSAAPPGWIPMANAISILLDECHRQGMRLVLGTGKCGDDFLALDLELPGSSVSTSTSPALAARTKSQRTTTSIARMCQIGADLFAQFGQHPAFAGFYIAHEPGSIDACTNLIKPIGVDGSGVHPGLSTYRLANGSPVEVWISPADVDDFPANNAPAADWETKAATLRSWGCTHVMPQDVVGSGEDINNVATWNPANRIAMLRGYFAQWRRLIDCANVPALSRGRVMVMGSNLELFQMDGPDYDNAYPATFARLQQQMTKTADQASPMGWYGVFPYATPDTLSLKLPQSYSGKTDFRTRANALWAGLRQMMSDAWLRSAAAIHQLPRAVILMDDTERTAPANATTAFTVGKHYPQNEGSRALIRLTLWLNRAHQAGTTSADVTLSPTINGVVIVPEGGPIAVAASLLGLPITIEFEHAHDGLAFEIGWSATVIAGVPAFRVKHSRVTIIETRR